MDDDISLDESRKIMSLATNVRPDENVHHAPSHASHRTARGRPVTAAESRRIMALAADIRPLENVHPDDDEMEPDDTEEV